jgi:hypothetical protein
MYKKKDFRWERNSKAGSEKESKVKKNIILEIQKFGGETKQTSCCADQQLPPPLPPPSQIRPPRIFLRIPLLGTFLHLRLEFSSWNRSLHSAALLFPRFFYYSFSRVGSHPGTRVLGSLIQTAWKVLTFGLSEWFGWRNRRNFLGILVSRPNKPVEVWSSDGRGEAAGDGATGAGAATCCGSRSEGAATAAAAEVGGLGAACYAGAKVMASALHAYVSKLFLLRIQILMSCLFASWCSEHSSSNSSM